jgi:thioredoxin-related protein
MIRIAFFLLLTLLSCTAFGQVEWIEFGKLPALFNSKKKPILIFVHTNWCKICKMQEGTVFSDDSIAMVVNTQFYALKLDAESTDSISFFGRNYKGGSVNKYHELAEYLAKADYTLSFPTLIVLNERLQIIYKKAGFVSKEELWELMSDLTK